jgi:multicomponent Na+:H+ antiporter subunit E
MPILFFIFWIALNARITVEVVVLGVIFAALASVFTYRLLGIDFKSQLTTLRQHWKHLLTYIVMIVFEVIKANVEMIRIILSPNMGNINPTIVYFQSPVKSTFSKIILCYNIALTPGTILFELEGDRIGIHTLRPSFANDILEYPIVKKLKKSEGS